MNNNFSNIQFNPTILNRTSYVQAIQTNLQPIESNAHHPIQNTIHSFPITLNHQVQPNVTHNQINHQSNSSPSIQNHVHAMPSVHNNFHQNQFHPLNQLTARQQAKSSETIWLENFVTDLSPQKANSPKKYCNACCTEVSTIGLDEHLRSNKHFSNRKKLNNQLLAVNLFQISKHYNQQLTETLHKTFISYEAIKAVKLLGLYD